MAVYEVALEVGEDGWCMAQVPELPGCFTKAPTQEEALGLLPAEIADYLQWLRDCGEKAPPKNEPIEVKVMETFHIPNEVAKGATSAAFTHDLKPLTKKELEWYLRLLLHSRSRLVAYLEKLEKEFGGWGEEFFKLLRWRPSEESRSILENVYHIFTAEAWYLARLAKEPVKDWEHYEVLRQLTIDRLRRLTPEERRQKSTHPSGAQVWTARKVMRRALWHERYHIRLMEQVLQKYRAQAESHIHKKKNKFRRQPSKHS